MNEVVIHDFLLLEGILHFVLANMLVDYRPRHVPQTSMAQQVQSLHDYQYPEHVFDLYEAEALLEYSCSVHAEEAIGYVKAAQIEHSVLEVQTLLDAPHFGILNAAAH